MLGREPTPIPFSAEALRANLLRLQNEWETFQASHDRDAVYGYLTAVFELVSWWAQEGKAVKRAHRASHLRGFSSVKEPEPFASRHSLHVRSGKGRRPDPQQMVPCVAVRGRIQGSG